MKTTIYISTLLQTSYPIVYQQLTEAFNECGTKYAILPYSEQVWAREYMPVNKGNGEYIGFKFLPDYLYSNRLQRNKITNQDRVIEKFAVTLVDKTNVVLDGSNFVFCDNKVIMTDKIFLENPGIQQSKLISEIENTCKAELVLIPWDTLEPYGYADRIVSYIGNGQVLLNNYGQCTSRKNYGKHLHKILSSHFDITELHFEVIAKGNHSRIYINYLDTPECLFLPALSKDYSFSGDKAARDTFKQIFKKPIRQVYTLPMHKHGAGLHSVTWDYNKKD